MTQHIKYKERQKENDEGRLTRKRLGQGTQPPFELLLTLGGCRKHLLFPLSGLSLGLLECLPGFFFQDLDPVLAVLDLDPGLYKIVLRALLECRQLPLQDVGLA